MFDATMDVNKYNFAVSREEFQQERALIKEDLEQDMFRLREQVSAAQIQLDQERAKLARRTDPNLRSSSSSEGNQALNLIRVQSLVDTARENLQKKQDQLRRAEAELANAESKGFLGIGGASQNVIDGYKTTIETLKKEIGPYEEEVEKLNTAYRNLLGLDTSGPVDLGDGGDTETEETPPPAQQDSTQTSSTQTDTTTTSPVQANAINDIARLVNSPNTTHQQLVTAYAKAKAAGVQFTPEQAAAIEAKIQEKL